MGSFGTIIPSELDAKGIDKRAAAFSEQPQKPLLMIFAPVERHNLVLDRKRGQGHGKILEVSFWDEGQVGASRERRLYGSPSLRMVDEPSQVVRADALAVHPDNVKVAWDDSFYYGLTDRRRPWILSTGQEKYISSTCRVWGRIGLKIHAHKTPGCEVMVWREVFQLDHRHSTGRIVFDPSAEVVAAVHGGDIGEPLHVLSLTL
jgi:hypothetical protein